MHLPRRSFVLLVVLWPAAPASGQDAPMFRGDPAHTATYGGPALPRTLRVKWKFRTADGIIASPSVAGGTVYIPSTDGRLYAIDAATGRERWHFATGARVTSSPAVAEGAVYFMSYDGTFYAVDTATGRERWKLATEGEHRFSAPHLHGALPKAETMPDPYDMYLSSPVVGEGTVYVGSGDGYIYAVDARSGTVRWKFKTGDVVHASPALADGTLYIGSWDSWFYALDAATGELRWRFKTGEDPEIHNQVGISSSALVLDGSVYFGCRDGHLYAVDVRTGTQRWSFNTDHAWVTTSPVAYGGSVYFGAGSSFRFFGADLRSGRETLSLQFDRAFFSSPAVQKDLLYVGNMDGSLVVIDPRSGRIVSRFQTEAARRANAAYLAQRKAAAADTLSVDVALYDAMMARYRAQLPATVLASPVIAGGVLYLASTDGYLYALQ
jgi:eukaryotic-like serine/threonine-protein kinase